MVYRSLNSISMRIFNTEFFLEKIALSGFNQADIAREIGVTRATVSSWVCKKTIPKEMEMSFSEALITGAIAAIALPPQIAVPEEIK